MSTTDLFDTELHISSSTTLIIHELSDPESKGFLDVPALTPTEIDSDIGSDFDFDDLDDYYFNTENDDFEADEESEQGDELEDHWFPSLFRKSLIEFLDDDSFFAPSATFDILDSSTAAEIEEVDEKQEDNIRSPEEEPVPVKGNKRASPEKSYQRRKRSKKQRKQRKSSAMDIDTEEQGFVPIEIVYLLWKGRNTFHALILYEIKLYITYSVVHWKFLFYDEDGTNVQYMGLENKQYF